MTWEQHLTDALRLPWRARLELLVEFASAWRGVSPQAGAPPSVDIPAALRAFYDRSSTTQSR
jgi:hypothetical protein